MSRAAVISLLCLFALGAPAPPAAALSTDSQQPIHIEADQAELDETRRVTVYKGSVVIVQGTMRIKADRVDFFYSEERALDKAVAMGKPAGTTLTECREGLVAVLHAAQIRSRIQHMGCK